MGRNVVAQRITHIFPQQAKEAVHHDNIRNGRPPDGAFPRRTLCTPRVHLPASERAWRGGIAPDAHPGLQKPNLYRQPRKRPPRPDHSQDMCEIPCSSITWMDLTAGRQRRVRCILCAGCPIRTTRAAPPSAGRLRSRAVATLAMSAGVLPDISDAPPTAIGLHRAGFGFSDHILAARLRTKNRHRRQTVD